MSNIGCRLVSTYVLSYSMNLFNLMDPELVLFVLSGLASLWTVYDRRHARFRISEKSLLAHLVIGNVSGG